MEIVQGLLHDYREAKIEGRDARSSLRALKDESEILLTLLHSEEE